MNLNLILGMLAGPEIPNPQIGSVCDGAFTANFELRGNVLTKW